MISGIEVRNRDVINFAGTLTALSFEMTGVARALGSNQIIVESVAIPIQGLPNHLVGTTFAQISDLHMGRHYRAAQLYEVIEIINHHAPEFLIITGDYISDNNDYTNEVIVPLAALDMPSFAILGNHDCWGNVWSIKQSLSEASVRLLWNESVEVKTHLWLVGLDDVLSGRPNMRRALADSREGDTNLLLVHEPDYFRKVIQYDIPVAAQFSGHTHGGQIRLPSLFPDSNGEFLRPYVLPALGEQYIMGRYQVDNKFLYVNRGLGFTGPPLRLNARPEITLFSLYAAS